MVESAEVISINGKEFSEDDLQDQSKYLVVQIRDLQQQEGQLNFKLDQIRAALKVMTDALIESVEKAEEE